MISVITQVHSKLMNLRDSRLRVCKVSILVTV